MKFSCTGPLGKFTFQIRPLEINAHSSNILSTTFSSALGILWGIEWPLLEIYSFTKSNPKSIHPVVTNGQKISDMLGENENKIKKKEKWNTIPNPWILEI